MACNFNCLFETEGRIITGNYVHCKSGKKVKVKAFHTRALGPDQLMAQRSSMGSLFLYLFTS